jgi:predicted DNA repair protein MutK
MTTAIDGLVAGIVKLDDGGLALIKATAKNSRGDFKSLLRQCNVIGNGQYVESI